MAELDILTKADAISVIKDNKTSVDYFIFDEFEIHANKIPPFTKQEWHFHQIIEEVLVVTEGQLEISWEDKNEIMHSSLFKGSMVRVKKSVHIVENNSNNWAEFIVFRMVPSGNSNREIIKNDKVVIEQDLYKNITKKEVHDEKIK